MARDVKIQLYVSSFDLKDAQLTADDESQDQTEGMSSRAASSDFPNDSQLLVSATSASDNLNQSQRRST